jgi:hypothetical protein
MWTHEDDKASAIMRLKQVSRWAAEDGALDQEEQHHMNEIIRMIDERVPAECFAGLGDV